MFSLFKKFIKAYGKNYKKKMIFLMFLSVVSGVIDLFGIVLIFPLIRLIIDVNYVTQNKITNKLYQLSGIDSTKTVGIILGISIVLIFIFKNLFMIFYKKMNMNILKNWEINVKNRLIKLYLNSDYSIFIKKSSTQLINNINNVSQTSINVFIQSFIQLSSNIIVSFVLISFVIVLSIHNSFVSYIGLTIFLLFIFSYLQYKILKKKTIFLGGENIKHSQTQYKNLSQSFSSIKETKVIGSEEYFINSFSKTNKSLTENSSRLKFYNIIPSNIIEIIIIISISILCVGITTSNTKETNTILASFGLLAVIAFRLAPLTSGMLNSLNALNASSKSITTLLGEIKLEDELKSNKDNANGSKLIRFKKYIKLKNVSFNYPNSSATAIKNVSVKIDKGEFIGIVGSSGAGKTTFVDIILGLLTPNEGIIKIDDTIVNKSNVRSWQKNIGYVPQNIYISNSTIKENVAFGIDIDEIDESKVEKSLETSYLLDFIKDKKDGIDTIVGENGTSLSGGQKQRVGIARSLYRESEILVLDEATSALDNITENKISKSVNNLKGNKTIIAIAHRLSTLRKCDKILFFRKGELIDTGSFKELSKHSDFNEMLQASNITDIT